MNRRSKYAWHYREFRHYNRTNLAGRKSKRFWKRAAGKELRQKSRAIIAEGLKGAKMAREFTCDKCGRKVKSRASSLEIESAFVYRNYDLCFECAQALEERLLEKDGLEPARGAKADGKKSFWRRLIGQTGR